MSDLDSAPPSSTLVETRAGVATSIEEPKDLGFGAVVGGANERRLLDRDGHFTARREGFPPLSYLNGYHALLTMTWPRFLAMVTVAYLGVNALFAWLFMLCGPNSLAGTAEGTMGGHFLRVFFFSIETFATIGYGNIYPIGPAANWLVAAESLLGILFVALLTGLVFARFSRPTAAVWFSEVAVVAPYQGKTAFEFRITNARSNQLMELEAKVIYTHLDGKGRQYHQLKLERTKLVFFPLSWTVVHPIDESSPLWGCSQEDVLAQEAEFLILLSGIDETFAQTVHARSSYKAEEVVFGKKFTSIYNPVDADGTISIDVSRLSETEDAPLDSDTSGHTQTFRHTGFFTGFSPPKADAKTRKKR